MSLWYMDTISFFCLDSEELCLNRLMLKQMNNMYQTVDVCINTYMHARMYVVCGLAYVLHGSLLPLLQSLPVFLQGADGVPRLTASPPQRAVSQNVLWVGFFDKEWERETVRQNQRMLIVMLFITFCSHKNCFPPRPSILAKKMLKILPLFLSTQLYNYQTCKYSQLSILKVYNVCFLYTLLLCVWFNCGKECADLWRLSLFAADFIFCI